MRLYMTCAAALLVSACATGPAEYNFNKTRMVDASFDETWQNVMSFFAESTIDIRTLEKDSGIVVAEQTRLYPEQAAEYADCGSMGMAVPGPGAAVYNVYVRPVDDQTTSVQVNARFTGSVVPLGGTQPISTSCNSKGVFENMLLDRITQ